MRDDGNRAGVNSVAQLRHGAVHDSFCLAVALGVSEAGTLGCYVAGFSAFAFRNILRVALLTRGSVAAAPLAELFLNGPADRHLLGNRERLSDFIRVELAEHDCVKVDDVCFAFDGDTSGMS